MASQSYCWSGYRLAHGVRAMAGPAGNRSPLRRPAFPHGPGVRCSRLGPAAEPGRAPYPGDRDCHDAAGTPITPLSAVASLARLPSGVAVRLICWFPPDTATVVVALFAADKGKVGDLFYDSVAARADPMIDQWKRE